jgi:hypothetical protein
MGPPRPRPDRIDVIATIAGVLAALAATWGVKVGLVRWRAEEAIATFTAGWQVDSATKQRLGRVIQRELAPLVDHPHADRLGLAGKSAPLWLSDSDLVTYQSLRKRMAFASESACSCLMGGAGCSRSDPLSWLTVLSDDEIDAWYHLVARGSRAYLDGAAPIPIDPIELEAGMGVILRAMPAKDRDRLIEVSEGRATTAADRCFAVRALFTGLEKFEPARQAAFTRALLSDAAGR